MATQGQQAAAVLSAQPQASVVFHLDHETKAPDFLSQLAQQPDSSAASALGGPQANIDLPQPPSAEEAALAAHSVAVDTGISPPSKSVSFTEPPSDPLAQVSGLFGGDDDEHTGVLQRSSSVVGKPGAPGAPDLTIKIFDDKSGKKDKSKLPGRSSSRRIQGAASGAATAAAAQLQTDSESKTVVRHKPTGATPAPQASGSGKGKDKVIDLYAQENLDLSPTEDDKQSRNRTLSDDSLQRKSQGSAAPAKRAKATAKTPLLGGKKDSAADADAAEREALRNAAAKAAGTKQGRAPDEGSDGSAEGIDEGGDIDATNYTKFSDANPTCAPCCETFTLTIKQDGITCLEGIVPSGSGAGWQLATSLITDGGATPSILAENSLRLTFAAAGGGAIAILAGNLLIGSFKPLWDAKAKAYVQQHGFVNYFFTHNLLNSVLWTVPGFVANGVFQSFANVRNTSSYVFNGFKTGVFTAGAFLGTLAPPDSVYLILNMLMTLVLRSPMLNLMIAKF